MYIDLTLKGWNRFTFILKCVCVMCVCVLCACCVCDVYVYVTTTKKRPCASNRVGKHMEKLGGRIGEERNVIIVSKLQL